MAVTWPSLHRQVNLTATQCSGLRGLLCGFDVRDSVGILDLVTECRDRLRL